MDNDDAQPIGGTETRLQAEESLKKALERSESWFRAFFEDIPAGTMVAGPDGLLLSVNRRLCTMTGLAEEELVGRALAELIHADDRDAVTEMITTVGVSRRAPSAAEHRLVTADGGYRWVLLGLTAHHDEERGLDAVLGLVIDVDERKRGEEKLREAYEEIAELTERLETENEYLRLEAELEHHHDEIIGQGQSTGRLLRQVAQVADTPSTVLLLGETGTGKEVVARAIHNASPRGDRTMVKINCAALPPSLIEQELFGREKGAFTGADTRQAGRFEVADGSTLFLDEIGEMPIELQPKLLRVLQEQEFERIGGTATLRVDVRVIAATNRDLERQVRDGRFREDLYYRLNVLPIIVAPLRERPEDIPLLVHAFVQEFAVALDRRIETIPARVMKALESHSWPGNVRELRNVIERAVILSRGPVLEVEIPAVSLARDDEPLALDAAQRAHITRVLDRTDWRVRGTGGAAELLELKPTTLESKMRRLGIQRKR
jgi:PAS domain S-box-containing protein